MANISDEKKYIRLPEHKRFSKRIGHFYVVCGAFMLCHDACTTIRPNLKSRLNDILFFWRFKTPNVLQGVIISSAEHDEFH